MAVNACLPKRWTWAMALFRVEAEALEALHDFADPKLLVVPRLEPSRS